MFAPILRMHRVTVEEMAILEPAVVESTMATCIAAMREAMDRAVTLGVPEQAGPGFLPRSYPNSHGGDVWVCRISDF
jgi:D-apionate oxidoisomerase